MSQPTSPRRKLRHSIMAALVGGLAIIAVAENVTVSKTVGVMTDKDPLSDPIESVNAQTQLQVLARENGWLKVRTPSGKEGYVSQDDLPANVNVAGLTGSAQSGGLSTSAAGKGLGEVLTDDAAKYSANHKLNPEPFNTVLAWGEAIKKEDLKNFDKEGHVGSVKHR